MPMVQLSSSSLQPLSTYLESKEAMDDDETSFRVTPDVFHKFQLILSQMAKNDGELIPEEIWHGEDIESETALKQTAAMSGRAASISLARSRLKQAEDLLDAFSFLTSSLQKRVSSLRARIPKWNITDLPDELLLLIFDYTKLDLPRLRDLLQVCKRFRQLALSSPRLWARQTLTLHSSPYDIDAVAERSGVLGFRAQLGYEFEREYGPKHAIFRHCKSWTSLRLCSFYNSDIKRFQTFVPSTDLSFLKELTIKELERIGEGRVWQFSTDWSLPSLRSLKCVDCVPRLLRASMLSECSITFSCRFPLSDVTAVLSSSTSIERLSIALHMIETYEDTNPEGVATVTLPNLKSLAVHLVNVDELVMTNIFETISSPNITSFLAIVGISEDYPDPNRGLRLLTKGLNVRYPLLKRVGLGSISGVFDGEEASYNEYDVNTTLKDLPSGVEDLVLLIRNQACDISIPSGAVDTLEGLRSFGLVHCNHLSEDFFDELPILLQRYGIRLDSIHIESCGVCNFHDMDLEDFMRMNDVKGSLIREGVTKKIVESRSVMMEDILASLEELMRMDWC